MLPFEGRNVVHDHSLTTTPTNTLMHSCTRTREHASQDKQKVKVKQELVDTQKELQNVRDSEEMQGMMLGPLEEMRREMK